METALEIKNGDVYRFHWHPDPEPVQGRDRYWCFDGQLVAVDGLLVDTFWRFGVRDTHSRTFTVEEACKAGELTYVCNVNDLEPAPHSAERWYDKADLFDLSHQHRCYGKLMLRKGAKKNKEAMLRALSADRKEAEDDLRAAVHKIEWVARTRQIVEDAADVEKVYP